jgi:poly-beta-1,6-N-acetyl-D-glucosamine biosynthesis protein PgaD
MRRSPWIIDVGRGRPAWLRYRDGIISIAMWILYLYLIRESFIESMILVKETFGWIFLQAPHPSLPKFVQFLYTLGIYIVMIIANGFILVGWATYNRYRFRGSDSRRAAAAVSVDQLGQFYGVSGEKIAEWQKMRSLVIMHDAEGKVISVVSNPSSMTEAPRARGAIATVTKKKSA